MSYVIGKLPIVSSHAVMKPELAENEITYWMFAAGEMTLVLSHSQRLYSLATHVLSTNRAQQKPWSSRG